MQIFNANFIQTFKKSRKLLVNIKDLSDNNNKINLHEQNLATGRLIL